jgi:hypothetical protein
MSAIQYLNVMTKKIAKDETKPSSSNVVQKKEKKQFKHGSNVIMKLGTYKGYYGYVYDFYPAKVEVEIEDQQYINAEVYGKKKIGSTIVTEFGDSTIIDKKKKMYQMNYYWKIFSLKKNKKLKKFNYVYHKMKFWKL